jgi:hypothetical protein
MVSCGLIPAFGEALKKTVVYEDYKTFYKTLEREASNLELRNKKTITLENLWNNYLVQTEKRWSHYTAPKPAGKDQDDYGKEHLKNSKRFFVSLDSRTSLKPNRLKKKVHCGRCDFGTGDPNTQKPALFCTPPFKERSSEDDVDAYMQGWIDTAKLSCQPDEPSQAQAQAQEESIHHPDDVGHDFLLQFLDGFAISSSYFLTFHDTGCTPTSFFADKPSNFVSLKGSVHTADKNQPLLLARRRDIK